MPLYGHTGENSPPWAWADRQLAAPSRNTVIPAEIQQGTQILTTLSYGFCLQGTFKKFRLVSCPLAQSWLISENHLLLRKKYAIFWGPPIIDMRVTIHLGSSVITAEYPVK